MLQGLNWHILRSQLRGPEDEPLCKQSSRVLDGLWLLPMRNTHNVCITTSSKNDQRLWSSNGSDCQMALIVSCFGKGIHVVCDGSDKPYKWQLGWQCDWSFLFTAYKVWGSMARLAALCHSRDATSSLCGCSSRFRLAPDKQTAQFWCLLVLSALRARSTSHTYSVQRWAYYHVNISPRLPRVCVWLVALRGVVMPRYYWCIHTFILVI